MNINYSILKRTIPKMEEVANLAICFNLFNSMNSSSRAHSVKAWLIRERVISPSLEIIMNYLDNLESCRTLQCDGYKVEANKSKAAWILRIMLPIDNSVHAKPVSTDQEGFEDYLYNVYKATCCCNTCCSKARCTTTPWDS